MSTNVKRQQHWEKVWSRDNPREVGWYQESPETSLSLVEKTGIDLNVRILDVGGGASTLVDGLLDRGFENIEVLDLTDSAFGHSRSRLGTRAERVTWTTEDVTTFRTDQPVDLWHDRAVLHFLTEERDRELYVRSLTESLAPAGHVIIATFALDGPRKCSGLKVVRYGPREITGLLGGSYQLLEIVHETHLTPGDIKQPFSYFRFQRQG
jgi:2-polyprenyl-3-methyl-5-hydroxy-6-metoxy-1,4-benzoquinol methylase